MGNYLKMTTQHQIETLLELGWAHRRIARVLGVHRETVGRYARLQEAKPANLIAGSEGPDQDAGVAQNRPNPIAGPASAAAAHHDYIEKALDKGLTAQRIWQDLVEHHGYGYGYLSVQRYARRLKRQHPEVADRMEHPPACSISLVGALRLLAQAPQTAQTKHPQLAHEAHVALIIAQPPDLVVERAARDVWVVAEPDADVLDVALDGPGAPCRRRPGLRSPRAYALTVLRLIPRCRAMAESDHPRFRSAVISTSSSCVSMNWDPSL